MTTRAILLVTLCAILGGLCLWMRGCFATQKIEMIAQIRPSARGVRAAPGDVPVDPVSFAFDQKYNLTSVRVVAVDDEKTNKYPKELWNLIADSNSVPTKVLIYGVTPRGMKPKIPHARPSPLEPDVAYKLYVEAGKAQGEKKFHTREAVNVRQ